MTLRSSPLERAFTCLLLFLVTGLAAIIATAILAGALLLNCGC